MQNEALVRALDVCIQKMQGGEKIEQAWSCILNGLVILHHR